MMINPLSTGFAPPQRATGDDLVRQTVYFSSDSFTRQLLDAIPAILVILNAHRQVVYANRTLLEIAGIREGDFLHGQRPGEILGCIHSSANENGCGSDEACSACGMIAAILDGLSGTKNVRECRVSLDRSGRTEALDLLVESTPIEFRGEKFCIFALKDISHEKRRIALEQIFFHDILNVVGSIKSYAELLRDFDPKNKDEVLDNIYAASERAVCEIEAQRTLSAAENGDLNLHPEPVSARMVMTQQIDLFRGHPTAEGKELIGSQSDGDVLFSSDRRLLDRVLGNMIVNALEATVRGGRVSVDFSLDGEVIEFRVHNDGCIPRNIQLQIFQRSFSTKGKGRGLGTYGMQLLSRYLGGSVSFDSSEKDGTLFRARFPLSPPS